MTENNNLAAVLRNCADMSTPCGNCPYKGTDGICIKRLLNDAADAIEALQAQLPKRGEIVRCGECKYRTELAQTKWHPCVDMAVNDDWFCADGERKEE